MMKWMHALQVGFEILADLEAVVAGQQAEFKFVWQGRTFTVTADPLTK
jgi:hypothetical protein